MKKNIKVLLLLLIVSAALFVFTACSCECSHRNYEWIEDKAATCTEAGERHKECSSCGESFESEIVEALGHDEISHEAKAPDCKVGWDAYLTCSRCDYNTYSEIPATGIHSVENGYCKICNSPESTAGLEYTENTDGTYTLCGIGSAMADEIVVGIYNNRDVTAIGENAFKDCLNIEGITIYKGVNSIEYLTFYDCRSLKKISVDESNTAFKAVDNVLYTKDGKTLIKYSPSKSDTEFTVANGVEAIAASAFYDCTSLKSVIISDSVTSIGEGAFYKCRSLEGIKLPDGVASIGKSTFAFCESLVSIELSNNLTSIGEIAFYACKRLVSVKIPLSVNSIGENAFKDCTSLESVTIPNSVKYIEDFAFAGCKSLTIYCEAEEKPECWENYWNYSDCPVVWNHKIGG